MNKNILVLLAGLVISSIAVAEPKALWCTDEDAEGAAQAVVNAPNIVKDKTRARDSLLGVGAFKSDPFIQKLQDEIDANIRLPANCKDSSWLEAFEFKFDTEGLKNAQPSDVEITRFAYCGALWKVVPAAAMASMSSTPTTISFVWGLHPYRGEFLVNRKTLSGVKPAGKLRGKMDFQCELKDIDTSDNLI